MKKQTEDIFEPAVPVVPQGWDVLPFEQAVEVISDKSKRVKQSAYLLLGKLPVIDQGQDFIGGYTDDEEMAFEGELPVILFGDHTRSIKYVERPFAVGAEGVKILKPSSGFDPKYFYYLLRSLQIPSRGYSRHFQFLRKFHFPRAPEGQQKRIVAEIEKQFSRLDEAVANLKRYKAAVEGRLVETEAELARREGRSYETGEQLLQRILETRRSQWKGKGKYKEPAAPDTTDLPELPEGWVWATLGQLVWSVKDGPHFSPKYTEQGVPFVSGGNIRPEGIDFSTAKFISPELHEELSKRCKPEYGDLLYTKGGTTGIARVNTEKREFNVWVHVAVLKLLDGVEPFYLQHALSSPHCYRQAQKYTHGVGNQDLGLTRMIWITVPLPSKAEQKRIVAEIDRRQSLVSETEAQIEANLMRADRFRQAILGSAFSGKLTISVRRRSGLGTDYGLG